MITPDALFLVPPGGSRISCDRFIRVLRERAAPGVLAERDPGQYFDAIERITAPNGKHVDQLFALAMFEHESSMGKKGVAVQTHSWGNTRAPNFGATPIGEVAGRSGTFPVWRDWLDGLKSTVARLATPDWVYTGWERVTIREIFDWPDDQTKVWAPAGDMNDPQGYLRAVIDFMNRYADEEQSVAAIPTQADIGYPVEVIWAADRGPARSLASVKWFIVHKTEGNRAGDIPTLTRKDGNIASTHCWIGRDGTLIFMVPLDITAWTPGNDAVARLSVNVELEGFEDEACTDAQYAACAAFYRWCVRQGMSGVPAEFVAYDERPGIIGHMHVVDPEEPGKWGGRSNHVDPGPRFDWTRLIRTIKGTPPPPPPPPAPDDALRFPGITDAVLRFGFKGRWQEWEQKGVALQLVGYPERNEFGWVEEGRPRSAQKMERGWLLWISENAYPDDIVMAHTHLHPMLEQREKDAQ